MPRVVPGRFITPAKYGLFSLFGGSYWLTKLVEQVTARVAPEGWADWVWNWVSYPALFVIAGFLISDFLNPNSDFRRAIRRRREVFDVKFQPSSAQIEGLGFYNRPRFELRSKKYATKITVQVLVHEHFQFNKNRPPKPIITLPPKNYTRDEPISLTVASIPRKEVKTPGHNFWGEQTQWNPAPDASNNTIISGADNVVELRVSKGKRILQTYSVFFGLAERDETDGKYFYLEETKHAFD